MKEFDCTLNNYFLRFEKVLNEKFLTLASDAPSSIKKAMEYGIKDGGKRVRPILLYSACDMLGVDKSSADNFALAIEMIHSYSLVHDDLPSIDNDDYRRGKLSVHKKFGEALGVLTGDALLNFAYETCLDKENFSTLDVEAMKILAEYAGYSGMIAGQVLDLESSNSTPNQNLLYSIYENKTSKLLTAPLLIASVLSGKKYYDELKELGKTIGLMFQISDDVMDVEGNFESIGKTPGKDEEENKLTSIKIWGIDGAKKINDRLYKKAFDILNGIPDSEFLTAFINKLYLRKK